MLWIRRDVDAIIEILLLEFCYSDPKPFSPLTWNVQRFILTPYEYAHQLWLISWLEFILKNSWRWCCNGIFHFHSHSLSISRAKIHGGNLSRKSFARYTFKCWSIYIQWWNQFKENLKSLDVNTNETVSPLYQSYRLRSKICGNTADHWHLVVCFDGNGRISLSSNIWAKWIRSDFVGFLMHLSNLNWTSAGSSPVINAVA